jgi:DHA1 family bicyclomycin/chloramphenicol resistance-like MFS transporter
LTSDKPLDASIAPSIWLLGAITGLSPFALTIVVPLLPMLGVVFDATPEDLQYLASAYIFGLAFAQPLAGILSDRFGRRPLLLSGLGVFAVASIFLVFCSSLEFMVLLRFAQAIGVSVGTVVARAVVRDVLEGEKALHTFSFMAAAMGVAPIFAPILGGLVGYLLGYSGVYLLTALMGISVLCWSWLCIPETQIQGRYKPQSGKTLSVVARLLKSPRFIGYTGIFGFLQCTFFSFMTVGAVVFEEYFGIGQVGFGVIWGLMATTYVAGSILIPRLARLYGEVRIIQSAVKALVAIGLSGVCMLSALEINMFTLLAPLGGLMFLSGGLTPSAMLGAVNSFPEASATASGISSSCGLIIGGAFAVLSGTIYVHGYLYISLLTFIATVCVMLSWLLVRSTYYE